MDCLFCNIAGERIPANIIYQDAAIIAFDDINPQAPQHKIIIPRKHIATLNDIIDADAKKENLALIASMHEVAITLAKKLNIADAGYRLLMNCNAAGGQVVYHLHMHLIGGRPMQWPPG